MTRMVQNATLQKAARLRNLLGTTEFFVSPSEIVRLLRYVLSRTTRPEMSINRRQWGGGRFVHRVEWSDLKFTSVSERPILVDE